MRKIILLLPALAMAASCASAPPLTKEGADQPKPELSTRRTTMLGTLDVRTMYADVPMAAEDVVVAQPATVRTAIRQMFASLDIPMTVDDMKVDTYGNNDFQKSSRIGNRPMSEYVDCGATAIGPRAATYRMYMSLITVVDSERPQRTRVKSTLIVTARDQAAGGTTARLQCSSTGMLERLLVDSISAKSKRMAQ